MSDWSKVRPGDWVKVDLGHGATAEGTVRGGRDMTGRWLGEGVALSIIAGTGVSRFDLLEHRPKPPPEPTRLGAVVRDATQVEWVHLGAGLWAYGTTDGPSSASWSAIPQPVEILSEGVDL